MGLTQVVGWISVLVMFNVFYESVLSKTEKNQLKFIVIGDIGGTEYWPHWTKPQLDLSKELGKFLGVDFFVNAGDNFYYFGIEDVNDYRFLIFEQIFFHSPPKNWYIVAGNHDYYGNVSAQILYSKKSQRWNFPNYFYSKAFEVPKSNRTLEIVMIDTTILCFTHDERYMRNNNMSYLRIPMEKWLSHTLEKSRADYLFVVGHHPMYSVGKHGATECLQDKLQDLFEKHKVTAYFSGHDHNLQHIRKENSGVHYFVSGAGTFVRPGQPNFWQLEPDDLKLFHGDSLGFWVLTANTHGLEVKLRTIWQDIKYQQYLKPRNEIRASRANDEKFPELLQDFFHSTKTG